MNIKEKPRYIGTSDVTTFLHRNIARVGGKVNPALCEGRGCFCLWQRYIVPVYNNRYMKFKAIFLLGTLKPAGKLSHTQVLCEFLAKYFEPHNVESSIVRLIDHNIKPGVYTHVDNDDWPGIFDQIKAADIIMFATPIWWNHHSSLLQRVIERMDEVHDDLSKNGTSVLANKVGGIVITGDSDGSMTIISNIANFCMWVGLSLAPLGSLSVLGDKLNKNANLTRDELWHFYEENYSAYAMAAAQNISYIAKLLKQHPLPEKLL